MYNPVSVQMTPQQVEQYRKYQAWSANLNLEHVNDLLAQVHGRMSTLLRRSKEENVKLPSIRSNLEECKGMLENLNKMLGE